MDQFSFEDLQVWKKAIDFARKVIDLSENIETDRKHYRLIEQLESSSASFAMNIAEGKGRYSKKEFIQFLYIAKGSLCETVTLLTIFYEKKWINDNQMQTLRLEAVEIGKMLSGLISSIKKSLT